MALALAEALPDFGQKQKLSAPAAFEQPAPGPRFVQETFEAAPPQGPTVEEQIASAEAALAERLRAEHAAEIESLRAENAQALQAAEERLGESLGTLVAASFAQTEERLVEITGSVTARILGMALSEDLEQRALESLAATIRAAMADSDATRIIVRGPSHLNDTLKASLGERSAHLEFHEQDGLDVTVSIDDKVFETRLGEWSSVLAEVLA